MYKRGLFRRHNFICLGIGILFLYVIYRGFFADNGDTLMSYEESSRIIENRIVQGDLRIETPKIEENTSTIFDVDERITEQNKNPTNMLGNTERDTEDARISVDINVDDDKQIGADVPEKTIHKYRPIGNSTLENKIFSNQSIESAKYVSGVLPVKSNMTAEVQQSIGHVNGMTDVDVTNRSAEVKTEDLQKSKTKLVDVVSVQTQNLAKFVQDALTKTNITKHNLTKTELIDGNATRFLDTFRSKAQNTAKLARILLGVTDSGVEKKTYSGNSNITKIKEVYLIETQDLVKVAKEVLSKSKDGLPDYMFVNGTALIEKFAMETQNLAKLASNKNINKLVTLPSTHQKFNKFAEPFQKKSSSTVYERSIHGHVLTLNMTKT